MKLLFVVPSFSGGGAERVVTVLASKLADRGIDTSCIIYYKAVREYEYSKNIKVFNLSGGDEENYRSLGMSTKVRKLRKLIISLKPDYIIPFLPQVGFHVWLATLGKKFKIIQTVRNDPRNDPPSRFERMIRNMMLSLSWRNFVQNKEQLDYFPKFIKQKTTILPNPVPEKLFEETHIYRKNVCNIVSLGRLSKQKNFEVLIQAADIVHKKFPKVKFHIYGDGELRESLLNSINKKKLESCVFLKGRTDRPYEKMSNSDVFVLSSDYEGMPNALLEAMGLGIPCISTNCPTGPEDIIIDKENGRLVPVGNSEIIADRIIEWIENPELLDEIGCNARRTILNNYSANVIADKFLKDVLLL